MNKYVRIYTHEWDSLSDFEDSLGECDPENVSHDDVSCDWTDDDEMGAVDYAVNALMEHGLTAPSSTVYTSHEWYTSPDGGYTADYRTGRYVEESGHLFGFSDDECRAIWQYVTGRPPSN